MGNSIEKSRPASENGDLSKPNAGIYCITPSEKIAFTIAKDNRYDLRKTYQEIDGKVVKDSKASITNGGARTVVVESLEDFNLELDNLKKNEAILSGVFPKPQCDIVSGEKKTRDNMGFYARTKKNVTVGKDSLYIQLLDNDPHPSGVTFTEASETITYLRQLAPVFKELEILARPSSSAGICLRGQEIKAVSWHLYIKVEPDVTPHALGEWISGLCWLAGDGYIALSKSGAHLTRCTFDITVFSPERLIFEAKPKLGKGITRKKYESDHQQGRALNLDDISVLDAIKISTLQSQAKTDIIGESTKVEAAYKEETIKKYKELCATPEEAAKHANALVNNELYLDSVVVLTDGTNITIKELCDNHNQYNGCTLSDPIEGRQYGTTTAKFYYNDGKPIINSFAHGSIKYTIVDTYEPLPLTVVPLSKKLVSCDIPNAVQNKQGHLRAPSTIESTEFIIDSYGIEVRYNEVSKYLDIKTPLDSRTSPDNLMNAGLALIKSQAAKNDLAIGEIQNYTNAIASQRAYNPVIDWFKSKPWDNVDRVQTLLECIKVEDGWQDARDTYVTKWLYSAAGLQTNEGDLSTRGVLTFTGKQNIGKTFFLQKLVGDMFKYCLDGVVLDPSNRDSQMKCIQNWIVELGELDSTFKRGDISALKAFVTLKKDVLRQSYAALESNFPRRTVFIASVNEREFLKDSTGNSRYWVLPVTSFDFEKLATIDKQQLWAEIWQTVSLELTRDPQHPPWFLNKEESKALEQRNASFSPPCDITDAVMSLIPHSDDIDEQTPTRLVNAKAIASMCGLNDRQTTTRLICVLLREKLGYKEGRNRKFPIPSPQQNENIH